MSKEIIKVIKEPKKLRQGLWVEDGEILWSNRGSKKVPFCVMNKFIGVLARVPNDIRLSSGVVERDVIEVDFGRGDVEPIKGKNIYIERGEGGKKDKVVRYGENTFRQIIEMIEEKKKDPETVYWQYDRGGTHIEMTIDYIDVKRIARAGMSPTQAAKPRG